MTHSLEIFRTSSFAQTIGTDQTGEKVRRTKKNQQFAAQEHVIHTIMNHKI